MSELSIVQQKIFELRGRWVILDRDLAVMYGVTTSALNQAVNVISSVSLQILCFN